MRRVLIVGGAFLATGVVTGLVIGMARSDPVDAGWLLVVVTVLSYVVLPAMVVSALLAGVRRNARDLDGRPILEALHEGRAPDDPGLDGAALRFAATERRRTRVSLLAVVGFGLVAVCGVAYGLAGNWEGWLGAAMWSCVVVTYAVTVRVQRRRLERMCAAIAARQGSTG